MEESQISILKADFLEGFKKGILRLRQFDFDFPEGLETIQLPPSPRKEIKCSGLGIDRIDDTIEQQLVPLLAQIEGTTLQRVRDSQALNFCGLHEDNRLGALLYLGRDDMTCGRVVVSVESYDSLCLKEFFFVDRRVRDKAAEINLPHNLGLLSCDYNARSLGALVGFGTEFDRQMKRFAIHKTNEIKQARSIGFRIRRALNLGHK